MSISFHLWFVSAWILWMAATVPTMAQQIGRAGGPGDAASAVDRYFAMLASGECDAVERIRPGFGRAECERDRDISLLAITDAGAVGALRLFRATVTREDTAQSFDLYMALRERDAGWTIADELVRKQHVLDEYRELISGAGEGEESDMGAVRPPPRPASFDRETPTVEHPNDTSAREVLRRFYEAIAAHECNQARALAPDYPADRCENVKKVSGLEIKGAGVLKGLELFHFDVTISRAEEVKYSCHVALRKSHTGWEILNDSLDCHSKRRDYLAWVERFALSSAPADEPYMADASESVTPWWSVSAPKTFGSAALLDACWSPGDLEVRWGDQESFTNHPLAYRGPPERLTPRTGIEALPPAYRGSIRSVDTGGERLIALTFDTGEKNNDYAGYDGEIVDYLRFMGIKATFYFGGKWMATHPERAMQIIADPLFEPGNHGWTHGNMGVLEGQKAADQILYTQAQYELLRENLLGRDCASGFPGSEINKIPPQIPSFRYPYGTCSRESLDMVNNFGLAAVQWSIVTGDPDRTETAEDIARTVLSHVDPGAIVIMHANGRGWNTAEALRLLVPDLLADGYDFVTVSELLRRGTPVLADTCYEREPGDNAQYNEIYGEGTGDQSRVD